MDLKHFMFVTLVMLKEILSTLVLARMPSHPCGWNWHVQLVSQHYIGLWSLWRSGFASAEQCELRPLGWQKMYAITYSTGYVASLEPRARQRYSEKLDIAGLSLEHHFIKRLEEPYSQQLTYHANWRGRNEVITTFESIYSICLWR